MSLQDTLTADMKAAMKAREKTKLTTIRMLLAAVKNEAIANRADLTEQQELTLLAREAKRRRESIEAYDNAERADLADKERAELVIIGAYLPAPLTADEVTVLLKEAIGKTGASSMKDMGKVMGVVMPKLKGRFDGKAVRPLLQALLS